MVARHDLPPQYRAGMPHEKTADWVATAYAVRMFRLIVQASRKGKGPVRWYKRLDLEALRKTVARYPLKGRLVDVAGSILSSTILTHPFPNANHRTSLVMSRLYLEFMGVDWPGYSMKGRGQKRLHRATHDFFRQSKYLLQLLRHTDLVRVAHEEGFTHLHIGSGTDAEIVPTDLGLSPDEVRERHEALCRRTLKEVATDPVRAQLRADGDTTLHEWVAWLKASK
ncbi:MAG: hypothetical protein HYT80_11580 [Euryarchaeota archaeon]|nr:hypothetical protein [Euryarchaeota archaeon]